MDLQRAGLIPEPFFGTNTWKLQKLESMHVFYGRKFIYEKRPGTEPVLVMEGVDTLAEVFLNGEKIYDCDNMFLTHRISIPKVLEGENELVIHILPVCIEVRKSPSSVYERACSGGTNREALRIRKSASMFGWDIMPRLVSAGIWRPVYIEYQPLERLEQTYLMTVDMDTELKTARMILYYDTEIMDDDISKYRIKVEGKCGDSTFCAQKRLWFKSGYLWFNIEDAHFWWPRGYGKPELYDVKVYLLKSETASDRTEMKVSEGDIFDRLFGELPAGTQGIHCDSTPRIDFISKEGENKSEEKYASGTVNNNDMLVICDTKEFRTGIRTVKLERTSLTDTEHNGQFRFLVNDREIFILGTNFVPIDAFPSRSRERLPKVMELLWDSNCNTIRVWGGGVYEDDYLYDKCDEMGILVWQDFMMACGIYPNDEAFCQVMHKEATQIIRRLRQHPSIMLWAGDNECDSTSIGGAFAHKPNRNRITRVVIKDAADFEDPVRPYLPSSPYIDELAEQQPTQRYLSENHLWGARDYFKTSYYRDAPCHFASEIGYHGCVSKSSMEKFLAPEDMWPWQDNPAWIAHAAGEAVDSKYNYRIGLMAKQIRELFGSIPEHLEDFSIASQISQAEAKKFFIENFRLSRPYKTGIIWWKLIDGWPQFSDAVVDYYFDKKLAYHYISTSQKSVLITFREPAGWMMRLTAINDTEEIKQAKVCVYEYDGKHALEAAKENAAGTEGENTDEGDRTKNTEIKCADYGKLILEKNFALKTGYTELTSLSYSFGEKKIYVITWETDGETHVNHYLTGNPPFDLQVYQQFLKEVYRHDIH